MVLEAKAFGLMGLLAWKRLHQRITQNSRQLSRHKRPDSHICAHLFAHVNLWNVYRMLLPIPSETQAAQVLALTCAQHLAHFH